MKTAIFSLIISICVALLSLFQFEKYQKLSSDTHNSMQKLEKEIKSNLEPMQKEIDKLATEEQTLLTQSQNTTWIIAESSYLVNAAALRLKAYRDVKSAVVLLSEALNKIQKLNDPTLVPLKEALKTDLSALQLIPHIDATELWLKATVLVEQVAELPFRMPKNIVNTAVDASTATTLPTPSTSHETTTVSAWKQALTDSWIQMKDLIKVRHHTKPIEPLIELSQQNLARENLRLMLEQLRFSILNVDSKMYTKLIQEIETWITLYFDETNEKVRDAERVLKALAEVQLQPELPTVTQSLAQFNVLRH